MIKNLLVRFFGYRLGQVVALAGFDTLDLVVDNASFKAFDATKGKFGYWLILNSDKNRYVVAKKYRI